VSNSEREKSAVAAVAAVAVFAVIVAAAAAAAVAVAAADARQMATAIAAWQQRMTAEVQRRKGDPALLGLLRQVGFEMASEPTQQGWEARRAQQQCAMVEVLPLLQQPLALPVRAQLLQRPPPG